MEEVKVDGVPPIPEGAREMRPDEASAVFTSEPYEAPPPVKQTEGGPPPEKGLEILISTEAEVIKTSQGNLDIGPMKMGRIADFLKVADKFLPLVKEQLLKNQELSFASFLNTDQESFFKAVAIAAKTTPELLRELNPDEFITVITKVFIVNLDFFVKTLPMALGVAELSIVRALNKSLPGVAGAMLSKSLSPTATDLKT